MIPSFDDVLVKLGALLDKGGLPSRIVWVAQEHTIFCRHEWKIFDDEALRLCEVRAAYEEAKANCSFGIGLGVLCRDGDTTYCYLYVPTDELNASRNLLASKIVKISIPKNVPPASRIRRGIHSMWYQLKELRVKKWKSSYFDIS